MTNNLLQKKIFLVILTWQALSLGKTKFERHLIDLMGKNALKREQAVQAIKAEEGVGAIGHEQLAEILQFKSLSKNREQAVRESAIALLLSMKPKEPRVLLKVAKALKDPSALVRAHAAILLLESGTHDEATLHEVCDNLLFENDNSTYSTQVKENAADLIAKLSLKDSYALLIYAKALASLDDRVREVSTKILIEAKPTDPKVISQIRNALEYQAFNRDFQNAVRGNAASVLKQIGAE